MKGKQGEGKGGSYPPSGGFRVHCKTDNSEADISRAIWKSMGKRLETFGRCGCFVIKRARAGQLRGNVVYFMWFWAVS